MDKLEPLIRHRFWILAGLLLPLSIYGYYAANAPLKADTQKRETALEGVYKGISAGNEPNETYSQGLSYINGVYEQAVNETIVDLWKKQQERMIWPAQVAKDVPKEMFGEFNPDTLHVYKRIYPDDVYGRLLEYVQPVRPVESERNEGASSRIPEKVVLATDLPQAPIGQFNMTSQEVWNAQIDAWLTRLLIDSIRNINADKQSVTEAVVRRLDRLEFLSGSGTPIPAMDLSSPGMGGASAARGNIATRSRGPLTTQSAAFDPTQEFGLVEVDELSAPPRYIGESDSAPYLERGFYMSVVILQNKIPDFIAELANSPWPVRIARFHVAAVKGTAPPTGSDGTQLTRSELSDVEYIQQKYGNFSQQQIEAFLASNPNFLKSGPMGQARGGASRRTPLRTNTEKLANRFMGGLPPYAEAALAHPDLVQLDLCGAITIFKQPVELMAMIEQNNPPSDSISDPTSEREEGVSTGENLSGPEASPSSTADSSLESGENSGDRSE